MELKKPNPYQPAAQLNDSIDDLQNSTNFNNFFLWELRNQTLAYYDFPIKSDFDKYTQIWTERQFVNYHRCKWLKSNALYKLLQIFVLIVGLILPDVVEIIGQSSLDTFLDIMLGVCLVICFSNLVISLIGSLEYFNSFYFYVDIVSIVILVFEMPIVKDQFYGQKVDTNFLVADWAYLFLNILKLVRVNLLLKEIFTQSFWTKQEYYKKGLLMPEYYIKKLIVKKADNKSQQQESIKRLSTFTSWSTTTMLMCQSDNQIKTNDSEDNQESKISKRMLYLTNKRITMTIIILLITIPLLSAFFWYELSYSFQQDIKYLVLIEGQSTQYATEYIYQYLLPQYKDYHLELLQVMLPKETNYTASNSSQMRKPDMKTYFYNSQQSVSLTVGQKTLNMYQSILNLVRMFIIFFVFLFSLNGFKAASRKKILKPLEILLSKVRAMANNPSAALKPSFNQNEKQNSDIKLIDETIQKIAYLLVLGFGEAGNQVFSKILQTNSMKFDFFKEAKVIYAIFGFCDIRNFTDVTEVLQENVLVFVNTIAQIVHSEVAYSQGAANKNIGDAFLLVWKLKSNKQSNIKTVIDNIIDDAYKEQVLKESYKKVPLLYQGDCYNNRIADQAFVAFLKVIVRLQIQPEIEKYNQSKYLKSSIPNFKVAIGFGLHAGWAIEGPIGSEFKIDISYLSSNVNWTSWLEGLTKTYHKEFLFTDTIFNLIKSKLLRRMIRKIDQVSVTGSNQVNQIYTIDLQINWVYQFSQKQKDVAQIFQRHRQTIQQVQKNCFAKLVTRDFAQETNFVSIDDIDTAGEILQEDKNLKILLDIDDKGELGQVRESFLAFNEEIMGYYCQGKYQEFYDQFQNRIKSLKVWKKMGLYNMIAQDPCLNFLSEQVGQQIIDPKLKYREIS